MRGRERRAQGTPPATPGVERKMLLSGTTQGRDQGAGSGDLPDEVAVKENEWGGSPHKKRACFPGVGKVNQGQKSVYPVTRKRRSCGSTANGGREEVRCQKPEQMKALWQAGAFESGRRTPRSGAIRGGGGLSKGKQLQSDGGGRGDMFHTGVTKIEGKKKKVGGGSLLHTHGVGHIIPWNEGRLLKWPRRGAVKKTRLCGWGGRPAVGEHPHRGEEEAAHRESQGEEQEGKREASLRISSSIPSRVRRAQGGKRGSAAVRLARKKEEKQAHSINLGPGLERERRCGDGQKREGYLDSGKKDEKSGGSETTVFGTPNRESIGIFGESGEGKKSIRIYGLSRRDLDRKDKLFCREAKKKGKAGEENGWGTREEVLSPKKNVSLVAVWGTR